MKQLEDADPPPSAQCDYAESPRTAPRLSRPGRSSRSPGTHRTAGVGASVCDRRLCRTDGGDPVTGAGDVRAMMPLVAGADPEQTKGW